MAKRYLINIFLIDRRLMRGSVVARRIRIMIRMRKSPMIYVIMYGLIGLS